MYLKFKGKLPVPFPIHFPSLWNLLLQCLIQNGETLKLPLPPPLLFFTHKSFLNNITPGIIWLIFAFRCLRSPSFISVASTVVTLFISVASTVTDVRDLIVSIYWLHWCSFFKVYWFIPDVYARHIVPGFPVHCHMFSNIANDARKYDFIELHNFIILDC